MIVCPNCNHQNPAGAVQCEACYTPLPTTTTCPNCGASVQSDASFCGQCGFQLKVGEPAPPVPVEQPAAQIPDPIAHSLPDPAPMPAEIAPLPEPAPVIASVPAEALIAAEALPPPIATSVASTSLDMESVSVSVKSDNRTQLQQQTAKLLHTQTNTEIELPQSLAVIHLGKPNDRIPPDIDISGFPNSEIVSRIHADIRLEGDAYYIEDVGSSNGTYINNLPLPMGNRHRLRPGDRIALGKGDKVTFLFQLS